MSNNGNTRLKLEDIVVVDQARRSSLDETQSRVLVLDAHRYTQIRYCENRVGKIAGLKSGRLLNGL